MTAAATEIQRYNANNRPAQQVSQATAVEQQRAIAEVQAAVVVAQSNPRDMQSAEAEMKFVCGRMAMAEHAFYQVTNRGTGPSVHLARELARIWGNIDYGVKELHRSDERGESEVLAFAWDQQRNTRSSRSFIVPHQRMKAGSRVDLIDLQDIYLNNQNIGARAVRETIFTILPRWFTEMAMDICRQTLEHGEGKPLEERIATIIKAFKDNVGVSQAQLEARIGKKRGQWDAGDIAQLTIIGQSIKRGEIKVDEEFPPAESSTADEIAAASSEEKPRTKRKPKAQKEAEESSAEPPQTTDVTQQEARARDGDAEEADTQVENTTAVPSSGDQDEPQPESAKPKTTMRKAVENRTFTLLGNIKPKLSRDERIILYRSILERGDINSTDDLDDHEVAKVGDTLYDWGKGKGGEERLNNNVREILNTAELAALNNEQGE